VILSLLYETLQCQSSLHVQLHVDCARLIDANAPSTTEPGNANDIDFNYAKFYSAIVDYFEITSRPHAQACVDELLAWWNM
jgi:hypothetical protein